MTGVLEYTGTHRVRAAKAPDGTVIVTEAGQSVEGSAGSQKQQVT